MLGPSISWLGLVGPLGILQRQDWLWTVSYSQQQCTITTAQPTEPSVRSTQVGLRNKLIYSYSACRYGWAPVNGAGVLGLMGIKLEA